MSNVKLIVMDNTREVLIGDITKITDTHIYMENVASVNVDPHGRVGLGPYMPITTDKELSFPLSSVRHYDLTPHTELANVWTQMFGSGIQIVPGSALPNVTGALN